MTIDLNPFLNSLRQTYGIVYVAVLSGEDYDCYTQLTKPHDDIWTAELPDGQIALASFSSTNQMTERFYLCGIAPKVWIELREFDDRFEEATYVADIHGRYVRVQTGMLDDMFGYIAVQSRQLPDTTTAIEDMQFKSSGRFDTYYEKLAASALVK